MPCPSPTLQRQSQIFNLLFTEMASQRCSQWASRQPCQGPPGQAMAASNTICFPFGTAAQRQGRQLWGRQGSGAGRAPGQALSPCPRAVPVKPGAVPLLGWAPLARGHGNTCEWGLQVPGAATREGSTRPGMLADETGRDYTYPTDPNMRPP